MRGLQNEYFYQGAIYATTERCQGRLSARAARRVAVLDIIHFLFTAYSVAPRARTDFLQNAPCDPATGALWDALGDSDATRSSIQLFIQSGGGSSSYAILHEMSLFAKSTAFTTYSTE